MTGVYEVEVTETLSRMVRVAASSPDEAQERVEEMINSGEVVLDADDFVGRDLTVQEVEI